jgi:hypothetical protein
MFCGTNLFTHLLERRQHLGGDGAETNAETILLAADTTHNDRVTVEQEFALSTVLERDRGGSLPRDLEHGAARVLGRATDRTGAKQVTRLHVATTDERGGGVATQIRREGDRKGDASEAAEAEHRSIE